MNSNKRYAGIGSREVPKEYLELIEEIALFLARKGFILRSGGAEGSDKAFERGCDKMSGEKEIWLPWAKFEDNDSKLIVKDKRAFEIAKKYHPYFDKLSDGAKKLQARNSHQVLGESLEDPVLFIVCYTKNGSGSGGTGQALRIAKDLNIPIFDLGSFKDLAVLKKEFNDFYIKLIGGKNK